MGQKQKRCVFFISDRTGITVETLARSLLSQFDGIEFQQIALPFVDSEAKARTAVERINAMAEQGALPLVFSTQVRPELRAILTTARCLYLDFFAAFLAPLENELHMASSHSIGRSHGLQDLTRYDARIEAINFALASDDGLGTQNYARADVILVGVSRSGKTPTCLYLALQYGVWAANYPFTEDELEDLTLPEALRACRSRLVGLTISAERLQQLRQARRPDSRYASQAQCQYEVRQLQALLRREQIHSFDSTQQSIEEIAATIVHNLGLARRR